MGSIALSSIVFACMLGGALLGIFLRAVLPERELSVESRDAVKLGVGLVGTIAAFVLGLLIASAKTSFDTQSAELTDMSSKIVLLDRILAHYGPEAKEAREVLRGSVEQALDQIWPKERDHTQEMGVSSYASEFLYDQIEGLSPKDDAERSVKAEALNVVMALGQIRWLIYEQRAASIPMPLLVVLVFLDYRYFVSFSPRRSSECDRGCQLDCLRAFGFQCDFLDPGDVRAVRRSDSRSRALHCAPLSRS